ncbi:hypothetical protein L486_01796 [Kwoniella mangroviensis CBS 10435]|uniref:Uncharacterized protein n=1 Tax=Kwoniella mangroviensis CBS 10435 TaxID=1331196 RepID=A0A1B9J302_9TREE|nr:hypothetical protein L486_01796 [Kwoniella mangroviensis CBS 10435]
MAEDITSWISSAIVQHDLKNGANYKIPIKGRYAQVIKFSSYRDRFDPHAEIRGVISDKTHWIRVKFDVEATDEFEEPEASLPSESLTSNLRAIFLIESFRIHLLPPPNTSRRKSNNINTTTVSASGDLPEVMLEILQWKVVTGDKDDPEYYPGTPEVSKGKQDVDVKVQRVLRKWWFGETNSSQSHAPSTSQHPLHTETPSRYNPNQPSSVKPHLSSPLVGYHSSPAIISTSYPSSSKSTQDHHPVSESQQKKQSKRGDINLLDFLQPYLNGPGGKKKVIPEWLFDKSDETKEMLDDIRMFGLDLDRGNEKDTTDTDNNLNPARDDGQDDVVTQSENAKFEWKGKAREDTSLVQSPTMTKKDLDQSEGAGDLKKVGKQEMVTPIQQPRPPIITQTVGNQADRIYVDNDQTDEDHMDSPIFRDSPSSRKSRQNPLPLVHTQPTSPENELEEESDEDIFIKPREESRSRKRGREMFDPLAMPSSSPAQEDVQMDDQDEDEEGQEVDQLGDEGRRSRGDGKKQDEGEEDEDGLSDYERETKRKARLDRNRLETEDRATISDEKQRKYGDSFKYQEHDDLAQSPQAEAMTQKVERHSSKPDTPNKRRQSSIGIQTINEGENDVAKTISSKVIQQKAISPFNSQKSQNGEASQSAKSNTSQTNSSPDSSANAQAQPNSEISHISQSQKRKISEILVDDSDQSLSQHKEQKAEVSNTSGSNKTQDDSSQAQVASQGAIHIPTETQHADHVDNPDLNQAKPVTTSFQSLTNDHEYPLSAKGPHPNEKQQSSPAFHNETSPRHNQISSISTRSADISPSHRISSNKPESSIKKPKIEHLTPVPSQTTPISRTQSTGKGSRKSFLESIRFFPSSSSSRVRETKKDEDDESPLKKRMKIDSDFNEGILGRLGRWARRGSSLSRENDDVLGESKVEPKNDDRVEQEVRSDDDDGEDVGDEDGDGLDDGLDKTQDLQMNDEVEIIVIEDEEEEVIEEGAKDPLKIKEEENHMMIIVDSMGSHAQIGIQYVDEKLRAYNGNRENTQRQSEDIQSRLIRQDKDEDEDDDDDDEEVEPAQYAKNDIDPSNRMAQTHPEVKIREDQAERECDPRPIRAERQNILDGNFELNVLVKDGLRDWEVKKMMDNIMKARNRKASKGK